MAFFRLRGLDRAAFRRLLGGLVEESSYSSAREKRSLNLRERSMHSQGGGLWPSDLPSTFFSAPWSLFLFNPTVALVVKSASPAGPLPRPSAISRGASLHLVGFITARLHMLQGLENWGLAEN